MVGTITAALLGGEWNPSSLSPVLGWAWWMGCICGEFGIALLGLAIFPRVRRRDKVLGFIGYYGDVVSTNRRYDLELALWQTADDPDSRTLDQLEQVSAIVAFKYGCLRVALLAFALGSIVLILVAVMAGLDF